MIELPFSRKRAIRDDRAGIVPSDAVARSGDQVEHTRLQRSTRARIVHWQRPVGWIGGIARGGYWRLSGELGVFHPAVFTGDDPAKSPSGNSRSRNGARQRDDSTDSAGCDTLNHLAISRIHLRIYVDFGALPCLIPVNLKNPSVARGGISSKRRRWRRLAAPLPARGPSPAARTPAAMKRCAWA